MMYRFFTIALVGSLFMTGCSNHTKETPAKTNLVVINVLDEAFFNDAHIQGSINVPLMQIGEYAQNLDKETEVVVYCSNFACAASGAAVQQLLDMGFEKVWAFEGGMAQWYQLGYPVQGEAIKDYLQVSQQKITSDNTVPVITAQELKQKMEERHLL